MFSILLPPPDILLASVQWLDTVSSYAGSPGWESGPYLFFALVGMWWLFRKTENAHDEETEVAAAPTTPQELDPTVSEPIVNDNDAEDRTKEKERRSSRWRVPKKKKHNADDTESNVRKTTVSGSTTPEQSIELEIVRGSRAPSEEETDAEPPPTLENAVQTPGNSQRVSALEIELNDTRQRANALQAELVDAKSGLKQRDRLNHELEKQNGDLTRRNQEIVQQTEKLVAANSKLEEQIRQFEQQKPELDAAAKQVSTLTQKLTELEAELQTSLQDARDHHSVVEDLNAKIIQADELASQLQQQNDSLNQKNDGLQNKVDELEVTNDNLLKQQTDLEQLITDCEDKLAARNAAYEELQAQNSTRNQELDSLTGEKNRLQDQLSRLETQHTETSEVLAKLQVERDEMQQTIKRHVEQNQQQSQQFESAQLQITELQSEKQRLTDHVESLERAKTESKKIADEKTKAVVELLQQQKQQHQQREQQQQEQERLQATLEQQTEKLAQQTEQLEQQNSQLETRRMEFEQLQSDHQLLKQQNDSLESTRADSRKLVDDLRETNAAKAEEIQTLKLELQQVNRDSTRMTARISELEHMSEEIDLENERLATQFQELQQKATEMELQATKAGELELEVTNLKRALSNSEQKKSSARDESRHFKNEVLRINTELESRAKSLSDTQANVESLNEANRELKQRNEQLEASTSQLMPQLEAAQQELTTAQTAMQQLETQLAQKADEIKTLRNTSALAEKELGAEQSNLEGLANEVDYQKKKRRRIVRQYKKLLTKYEETKERLQLAENRDLEPPSPTDSPAPKPADAGQPSQQVAALQDRLHQLQVDKESLADRVSNLETMETIYLRMRPMIGKLKQEISDNQEKIKDLSAKYRKSRFKYKSYKQRFLKLAAEKENKPATE